MSNTFKRWYRGSGITIYIRSAYVLRGELMSPEYTWAIDTLAGDCIPMEYQPSGLEWTRTAALAAARGYIDRVLGERAQAEPEQPAAPKAKRRTPRSHAAKAIQAVLAMSPAERLDQRARWHDQALRQRLIAQGIIKTA